MSKEDKTPGGLLYDLLYAKDEDKPKIEKDFQKATKEFFASHGVNCTFGEESPDE